MLFEVDLRNSRVMSLTLSLLVWRMIFRGKNAILKKNAKSAFLYSKKVTRFSVQVGENASKS